MLGCFSSMTSSSSRPRRELADGGGIERQWELELEQSDPQRRDRLLVGESEPSERLPQLPIGDAGRGDADPCVARVGGGAVESIRGGVGRREPVADLVDLAFEVEAQRSQQPAFGWPRRLEPVDLRDHRTRSFRVELDRRGAVGDIGHDLHCRPQSAGGDSAIA